MENKKEKKRKEKKKTCFSCFEVVVDIFKTTFFKRFGRRMVRGTIEEREERGVGEKG